MQTLERELSLQDWKSTGSIVGVVELPGTRVITNVYGLCSHVLDTHMYLHGYSEDEVVVWQR